jgi:hypothetical protein
MSKIWCQTNFYSFRDNYAYLADSNYGLIVLDIGNPTNPTLLYNDSTPRAHHVFIKDDYLYIEIKMEGFYIYNVSDPANPCLVKTISLALTGDLVINKDKAFASAGNDITVYDISNPSSSADLPAMPDKMLLPNLSPLLT